VNKTRQVVTAAVGAVLAVVGLVVHGHAAATARLCNSDLGQLGQAFSSAVSQRCSSANTSADLGLALIAFGAVLVLAGVGSFLTSA